MPSSTCFGINIPFYAPPGMETRSTIRAGPPRHASGRLMLDLLRGSAESLSRFPSVFGGVALPRVVSARYACPAFRRSGSFSQREASPSPVYGARLLSGLRAQPSRGFKSRRLRQCDVARHKQHLDVLKTQPAWGFRRPLPARWRTISGTALATPSNPPRRLP